MKVYRFVVHPEEHNYLFFLECINDPKLYTQARSMDEALLMARDVVECMYEQKGVMVELVVPPDVTTAYERRRQTRAATSKTTNSRRRIRARAA